MQKIVLKNGLKVIFKHKKGNSVVIQVMIKVGSNNEKKDEKGISHFIEHMLFEGTKKRPTNWQISNEIESIGGEFNAYTTNERTCFYVKVLKKHFSIAIDVIADIIQNSLFNQKEIDKEKNVVIKEIDMVLDEPRFYQWDLLQSNIFEKHPAKYPVYGRKKIIQNLSQEKILQYFNNYYNTQNMTLSIVGDVQNWKSMVKKHFINCAKTKTPKMVIVKEPITKKNKEVREKRKIASTYAVMGFKTVPRNHPDSYVLEVINGILGRGQSGRMFTEIRAKQGLAYDVGTQDISEVTYGYFAIYVSVDKSNLSLAKKLILKEIKKLKNVTLQDIKESMTYIEGEYLLDLENSQKVADQILFWEQTKDANLMNSYIKKIKNVTVNDVKRVINKYFNNYTFAVVEGK